VLKPALARGEVQASRDHARRIPQYIEKDSRSPAASAVIVNPPSQDEAIQILKGLRDR